MWAKFHLRAPWQGILILVCASLWVLFRFYPAQPDPTRVYRAIFSQNPPYYYQPEGASRPVGAIIDLFDAAAALRGIRLDYVLSQGTPEILLRQSLADLILMAVVTPDREREFKLTDPWLRVEAQLLWRKQPGETGTPSFDGKRLGVPGFRLYETAARQQFAPSSIVRRSSRNELLDMVCLGEIDATLLDARSASMLLLDRGPACANIPLGMSTIDSAANDIAIMSTVAAFPVARALREDLSRLSRDGTMIRIYERWGVGFLSEVRTVETLQLQRQKNDFLRGLLILSAILLLAVAILAFQYRRLLRRVNLASQAKSAFLATMSHETRTPLNGIIGLAEALAEESREPSHRQMANSIAQCGRNLVSLVSDVLDHSKLEANKLNIKSSPFHLADSIRPIAASLGTVARQKDLTLEVNIHQDLPDWVSGDSLRIAQVLFNLLGNAVKFTHQGKVTLQLEPGPAGVRFSVIDTGIGLSLSEQAQIFTPFWQADQKATRKIGGTGLGLAISRRLVEAMGGKIGCLSELGRGSTFWFELPLPATRPVEASTQSLPAFAQPLKILFAEDNLVNQRVVERLLKKLGHSVTLANNGAEAVDLFSTQSFDAVLLDCHMPVEDGFSAARRIRALESGTNRRIPVLALTALAFEEDRALCLAAGMDDHLTKPVNLETLAASLARFSSARPAPMH